MLAFMTLVLSISGPVLPQQESNGSSIHKYKIKLAMANLPLNQTLIESLQKNNNLNPASPESNSKKGLLFSLKEQNNFKNKSEIAYNSPATTQNPIERRKWEEKVKIAYKNGLLKTVAPGIKHIKMRKYTSRGPLLINILEINPNINPNIIIEPALAGGTLPNKAKVKNIAVNNSAVAGINASFFKPNTGVSLGTVVINSELITGPIYERVSLGIKGKSFRMAKLSLEGKVITSSNNEIKIDNINQPRMLASYVLLYSYRWGSIAPAVPKYGVQIAVNNNFITEISQKSLNIPVSGYLISGPLSKLGRLKVGDELKLKFTTSPDWSDVNHAISGGPYLIKDGKIYVDSKEEKLSSISGRHPRTAVGFTKDNRLIMVTVDGRQNKSIGVTFWELAEIMKNFGCWDAMNLDGGTSTQMYVSGKVVNSPLYAGGFPVGSGILIKIK
jgi:exopolysaccharide biosynthesis protein